MQNGVKARSERNGDLEDCSEYRNIVDASFINIIVAHYISLIDQSKQFGS